MAISVSNGDNRFVCFLFVIAFSHEGKQKGLMTIANSTSDSLNPIYTVYKKKENSGQYRTIHRKAASNVDLVPRSTILTSTAAFSELGGDLSVKSH